ncbi:unnamed protein product, partial [Hapterophycus canaliculatus]
ELHEHIQRQTIPRGLGQVEMLIRSLGLHNAKDTIVGNNSRRGVSGGERRRVTLGE